MGGTRREQTAAVRQVAEEAARDDGRLAGRIPTLTVVDGGVLDPAPGATDPAIQARCVLCGADVETLYVWMDWGPGREAVCGRECAEALLDVLDAFLESQQTVVPRSKKPTP
jgi:hypothetical protein